jgi:hypothetical protein
MKRNFPTDKSWLTTPPIATGTYKMESEGEILTIFVEQHGTEMCFRVKGQPWTYSFNGTEKCKFQKV